MDKQGRIRKFGEVFTPQWIVDKMCDDLQSENPNCFHPVSTFLEPTCGEGIFVLEILRRKFTNCQTRTDYTTSLKSVYAMEIQADNVEKTIQNVISLCNEYFKPTKQELEIIKDHIIQADALKVMKMMNDPALTTKEAHNASYQEKEISSPPP